MSSRRTRRRRGRRGRGNDQPQAPLPPPPPPELRNLVLNGEENQNNNDNRPSMRNLLEEVRNFGRGRRERTRTPPPAPPPPGLNYQRPRPPPPPPPPPIGNLQIIGQSEDGPPPMRSRNRLLEEIRRVGQVRNVDQRVSEGGTLHLRRRIQELEREKEQMKIENEAVSKDRDELKEKMVDLKELLESFKMTQKKLKEELKPYQKMEKELMKPQGFKLQDIGDFVQIFINLKNGRTRNMKENERELEYQRKIVNEPGLVDNDIPTFKKKYEEYNLSLQEHIQRLDRIFSMLNISKTHKKKEEEEEEEEGEEEEDEEKGSLVSKYAKMKGEVLLWESQKESRVKSLRKEHKKWMTRLKDSEKKFKNSQKMSSKFRGYRLTLEDYREKLREVKKLENILIINEDNYTEEQEEKLLSLIRKRKKERISLKRKLEKFQKEIFEAKDVYLVYKEEYLNHLRNAVRGRRRKNKSIMEVFEQNTDILIVDRSLDDYTDLKLIYSNNENRIFKGRLKTKNEEIDDDGDSGESDSDDDGTSSDDEDSQQQKNQVIIKVLPFDSGNEKIVQNEVLNLVNLKSCPYIISISCVFQFRQYGKHHLGLEMEFCEQDLLHWLKDEPFGGEDEDLLELLKKPTKRSKEQVKEVFRQIAQALVFIHSQGIIHRDLKPQNILYSKHENRIKIIDFGISRNKNSFFFTTVGKTKMSELATPRYKPPESPKTATIKYDIYSFGLMLYESLVEDSEHVDFVSLDHIPTYFEKSAIHLLKGCLAQDPSKRLSSIEVVGHSFFGFEELEEIRSNEVIDSSTKIQFVLHFLKSVQTESTGSHGRYSRNQEHTINFNRNADDIVKIITDLTNQHRNLHDLLKTYLVNFSNDAERETGIDQGGLTNELYNLFCEEFSKSKFVSRGSEDDENSVILPTDEAHYPKVFEGVGRFLLRILFLKENTIRMNLSQFVYAFLVSKLPHQMSKWILCCEEFDPMYMKSLEKILLESDPSILELFTFESDETGEEIPVTMKNKEYFVIQKIKCKLMGKKSSSKKKKSDNELNFRMKNLQSLRKGFFSLLPKKKEYEKMLCILNPKELRQLIYGSTTLTSSMMIKQIIFYHGSSQAWNRRGSNEFNTKKWLIQYLTEYDTNENILKLFLYYCTALMNLPFDGELKKKITIKASSTRTFAHTCTNIRELEVNVTLGSYQEFKNHMDNILKHMKMSGMYE